ncbi:AAA domain-containing protein [Rhodocollybia butyracea]|uniref:AAA domain-containing protein n=1 Tax=Rhodocollybia butyracea TaxID=206335 RepID=A0A9P5P5E5_9AGAR|nr:AAA domain-containing protein [Rhodocollybia butyracea]
MAMMIGQKISLIQGVSTFLVDFIFPSNHAKQPPGTGKTLTIISTVKLLKIIFRVLNHFSYPEYLELEKRAKKITDDIKELHGKIRKLAEAKGKILSQREVEMRNRMLDDVAQKGRALGAVKKKSYGLEQEITREIVNNADVICTTCITSASAALNIVDFPVVFLDEASMSTEPASLIPLMKGSRHLALIGDHKQLPPVITSPEAQSKGLAISLFERLTLEGGEGYILPTTTYSTSNFIPFNSCSFDNAQHSIRMHPAISHFPSSNFITAHAPNISPTLLPPSILANGLTDLREKLADGEVRTSTRPSVIFLDHSGTESAKSKSRVNWSEAHIVASVVEDLLLKNDVIFEDKISESSLHTLHRYPPDKTLQYGPKYRQRFNAVLGEHRAMQLTNIEIKTVDGFEGREKEVIIFSPCGTTLEDTLAFSQIHEHAPTRQKCAFKRRCGESGKGAESWRRYMEYVVDQGLVLKLILGRKRCQRALWELNNVNGVLTPSSSLPIAASLRS